MKSLPDWVRLVFGVGSFLLMGCFIPQTSLAASTSTFVIGEVQWAGSSRSTADEWIELWNLSDTPLSLGGYQLIGASADPLTFSMTDQIPAQGTFLISNYSATDTKSTLMTQPQVVTTTVSLSNSALHLQLFNPQHELIDEAGTGQAPPAGSTSPLHSSMIRDFSTSTNAWFTALTAFGLQTTNADQATPGFCDGCVELNLDGSDENAPVVPEPVSVAPPSPTDDPATSTIEMTQNETPPMLDPLLVPSSTDAIVDSTGGRTDTPSTTELALIEAKSTHPVETTSTTNEFINVTSTPPSAISTPTSSSTPVQSPNPFSIPPVTAPITTNVSNTPIIPVVPPVSSSVPTPFTLQLNEISPAPRTHETEWIELIANRPLTKSDLIGWSLENDRQSILRLSTSTVAQVQLCGEIALIPLKGSRLKNTGDEIRLKNGLGALIEIVRYPQAKKGESWIRWPDKTGAWQFTSVNTPCKLNNIRSITPTISTTSSPATNEPADEEENNHEEEVKKTDETDEVVYIPVSSSTNVMKNLSPTVQVATAHTKPKTTKPSAKKVSPKKSATTKKSSAKAVNIPPLTSFDDLSAMPSNVRVRLTGIVGSQAGLLATRQFVIQTEDGRGLLITGSTQQLTPPFGSLIEVIGTLHVTDQGVYLSMLKNDRWRVLKKEGQSHTRSVELLAPSLEDQWSLIQATGTVVSVNKTSFNIESDGVGVTVMVRSVIHYRTERLKKGDVVAVLGLLDHRTEQTKLIPRNANEITLLQHPVTQQSQLPLATNTIPPWMPIGAAGMTIASVQGFKKFRKVREEKRLKAVLEIASKGWESHDE